MILNVIILSSFIYLGFKKFHNNQFIYMPPFEKYCIHKPTIEYFINVTQNMKLCQDGYYPYTIIINKKYNNNKNSCIYHVICTKNKHHIPEYIIRDKL